MVENILKVSRSYKCPNCGSPDMSIFYEIRDIPAHSVMLIRTRNEAVNCAKGDIELGFCLGCGFISNVGFDPDLHKYSSDYEENQAYSSTFDAFHHKLALNLIERFGLHNKDIIEIGCGKGDFLALLCDLGQNRGIGFDPSYVDERSLSKSSERVFFIKDFYSERYGAYKADFICCKMTLEHIQHPSVLLGTLRESLEDHPDGVVFFQVPDVTRILREKAFWDIYYEHCSYFSEGSLTRLFQKCGFHFIDLWRDYGNQYLMIAARPGRRNKTASLTPENDLEELKRDVGDFSESCPHRIDTWKSRLADMKKRGQRSVLWGGGSKGVAFLTTLHVHDEIQYVVDINPHKNGTFIAGTGQRIVTPEFLPTYKPDAVIIMNPIYSEEIRKSLLDMGLNPELVKV